MLIAIEILTIFLPFFDSWISLLNLTYKVFKAFFLRESIFSGNTPVMQVFSDTGLNAKKIILNKILRNYISKLGKI